MGSPEVATPPGISLWRDDFEFGDSVLGVGAEP
jgi:hypothetical protein